MSADALHYVPLLISHIDWSEDNEFLLQRRSYWHSNLAEPVDVTAHHYLALRQGQPVGYLRLTASGELDVIGAYGNQLDIHQALLRFAMMDAPLRGHTRLWAPQLSPWQTLLPDLGFTADEQDDAILTCFLAPHRTRAATGSALVRLNNIDALRDFALQLAQAARRTLVIYSEDLEPWLYDTEPFADAVRALVRRNSKFVRIEILLRDTRLLQERGHRLLSLYHQTDAQVCIRKLTTTGSSRQPAYMIADDCGLLFRPDAAALTGIGYLDYRARVKTLLDEFHLLWNVAREDHNLRQMSL